MSNNKAMAMRDARGGARASAGALTMMEYIMGVPGKSGFGASSTAESVTAQVSLHGLTSIVTGARCRRIPGGSIQLPLDPSLYAFHIMRPKKKNIRIRRETSA
jgi:hypothetical protein